MRNLTVINRTTCFSIHAQCNVNCNRKSCDQWIDHAKSNNCTIIAAKQKGSHTLQEIGEIFGVTRMRTCQIEHDIMTKIKSENQKILADQD